MFLLINTASVLEFVLLSVLFSVIFLSIQKFFFSSRRRVLEIEYSSTTLVFKPVEKSKMKLDHLEIPISSERLDLLVIDKLELITYIWELSQAKSELKLLIKSKDELAFLFFRDIQKISKGKFSLKLYNIIP